MPTPEAELKKNVVAALNKMGVFYLRLQSGRVQVKRGVMHLCPEGTSDFLVCCPDPRWIELKAPGQGTRKSRKAAQAAFGERVVGLGHKHAICTSVEEVLAFCR